MWTPGTSRLDRKGSCLWLWLRSRVSGLVAHLQSQVMVAFAGGSCTRQYNFGGQGPPPGAVVVQGLDCTLPAALSSILQPLYGGSRAG